ncbi:hypothetical protein [Amycolatopsis sp. NPDC050768]|uniref:hypothetical protein n=1 Tax=Amycolatopsis sp. NPDC050768 TaxID=3154839 RepID=UPI0033FF88EF
MARTTEAGDVVSFALSGDGLPAWTPGAHIDVEVRPGDTRQYSLDRGAARGPGPGLFRAPGKSMMICVSRSRSAQLVLDV